MDSGKFAQVLTGLPGVTAAARVLVGAGYEWTTIRAVASAAGADAGLQDLIDHRHSFVAKRTVISR